MGHPSYFQSNLRCYDGVQRTARPAKFRFMGGVGLTDLSGFGGKLPGPALVGLGQPRLSNYGPSALVARFGL